MSNEKIRVMKHSSNIFYHMSIVMIVICFLMSIAFAFDIFHTFASFVLFLIMGAFWIVLGVLGLFTLLILSAEYRGFLGSFGKVLTGLFDPNVKEQILKIIMEMSHYYWIFVAITIVSISLYFTFTILTGEIRDKKNRTVTMSIMGVVFLVSLVFAIVMLTRISGGVA